MSSSFVKSIDQIQVSKQFNITREQQEAYLKLINETLLIIKDRPIPFKELRHLIHEIPSEGRRVLFNKLLPDTPISKAMKYTSSKIITLLRTKYSSSQTRSDLYIFLYGLLQRIYLDYEINNDEGVVHGDELTIRELYGDWHYYFALLLSPKANVHTEKRAEELLEEIYAEMQSDQVEEVVKSQRFNSKDVERENELLQNERKLRIQLQEKNVKAQVLIEQLQEQLDGDVVVKRQLEENIKLLEEQVSQLQLQREESHRLYQEVVSNYQRATKDINRLQKENIVLTQNIEKMVIEKNEVEQEESKLLTLNEAYSSFYNAIKHETNRLMQDMISDSKELECSASRIRIKECFDMLTLLEEFNKDYMAPYSTTNEMEYIDTPFTSKEDVGESLLISSEPKEKETVNEQHHKLGKFLRYDHGGKVEFEDGSTINITESIVNTLGLKHNALVECMPKEQGGYHFSLIMQGDNEDSDVSQFLGYIKLEPNDLVYCVDVNTNQQYDVHFRDVEHWNVTHGVTGLFNRYKNNTVARISKIFPKESVQTMNMATTKYVKKEKNSQSTLVEPFLEGCKIVIVGGMEKWFSDTVALTGAELIHNTGEQPSRVYSDIKTANALFLLLTANSHNATWGAIDVAKKNNVPHFKIQGSRSNLLAILRENQDLIKGIIQ